MSVNMEFETVVVAVWKQRKDHCKDSKIEFNLPVSSVKNIMKAKKCYYTGVPLDWTGENGEKISMDRVDATRGYVVGNVVACCAKANAIKSSAEHGHRKAEMKTAEIIAEFEKAKRVLEISIKRMKLGVK